MKREERKENLKKIDKSIVSAINDIKNHRGATSNCQNFQSSYIKEKKCQKSIDIPSRENCSISGENSSKFKPNKSDIKDGTSYYKCTQNGGFTYICFQYARTFLAYSKIF